MVRKRVKGEKANKDTIHNKRSSCASAMRHINFSDALSYIDYFLQHYGIPWEDIPEDPLAAAEHHVKRGRIPLPKDRDKKRVCFKHKSYRNRERWLWKNGTEGDYSKKILTLDEIQHWDYSDGMVLVVPTDWRDDVYLDIDMRSEEHKDGIDPALIPEIEALLKGFHYERTKHDGIHIFGKGHPQEPPAGMGLQIVNTLIATFPSPGYPLGKSPHS